MGVGRALLVILDPTTDVGEVDQGIRGELFDSGKTWTRRKSCAVLSGRACLGKLRWCLDRLAVHAGPGQARSSGISGSLAHCTAFYCCCSSSPGRPMRRLSGGIISTLCADCRRGAVIRGDASLEEEAKRCDCRGADSGRGRHSLERTRVTTMGIPGLHHTRSVPASQTLKQQRRRNVGQALPWRIHHHCYYPNGPVQVTAHLKLRGSASI